MEADKDGDGRLSFEEFTQMVANTVHLLRFFTTFSIDYFPLGHRETNDTRGSLLTLSSLLYLYLLGAELFLYHTIGPGPCHESIRCTDITDGKIVMMNKLDKWAMFSHVCWVFPSNG